MLVGVATQRPPVRLTRLSAVEDFEFESMKYPGKALLLIFLGGCGNLDDRAGDRPPTQSSDAGVATPDQDQDAGARPSEDSGVSTPPGIARWSDPATWGGQVPSAGQSVVVPEGADILLDQNIDLKRLTIFGTLQCAPKDLDLRAEEIMVHGRFVCGIETDRYEHQLKITLVGDRPPDVDREGLGMGTKVLGVMAGGRLEFHGEDRMSWLHLDETVNPGADRITLSGAANWRPGDQIIITSSSQDYQEAEVKTIASIEGRAVTLTSPLSFRHFGEVQVYSNDQRTWTADTRAEVGLLSRNIQIAGDEDSAVQQFGGHIMVMSGSSAYLSGVELTRMGQYAIKGRYPFHWHLAGDIQGQYIRNSAIHDSYNRCITVHGSHNGLIDDNVCFKHVGHGFFLEDGIEQGNVFNHNLGLWTIRPPSEDALLESDWRTGPASDGPSTFWISNGNNVFTNNSAAGSDGLGYWYDTEDAVTGLSADLPEAQGYSPRRSEFGQFKDNTVHSSGMALAICSESSGRPGYNPPGDNGALIENLTVYYGGAGAVWPCGSWHRFVNMKVLDTGTGPRVNFHKAAFVSAFPAFIDESLFVSNSALAADAPQSRSAFGIYDFGTRISNSHFVNYSESLARSPIFSEVGGAVTFMYQGIQNVTRDNSEYLLELAEPSTHHTSGNVIRDVDGSISGRDGRWSIAPNAPLMRDAQCEERSGADDAVLCPYFYGQIQITTPGIRGLPPVAVSRTDVAEISREHQPHEVRTFYKVFVPLNQSEYHHTVDFRDAMSTGSLRDLQRLSLRLTFGLAGDTSMLGLQNLPASARIASADWSLVGSLSALRAHPGRAWFKSGTTIHLKFRASGDSRPFASTSNVDILLD